MTLNIRLPKGLAYSTGSMNVLGRGVPYRVGLFYRISISSQTLPEKKSELRRR
jgi:hypothetical protein